MPPPIFDDELSSTYAMPAAQNQPATFTVLLKPANNPTDTREITLRNNAPVIIGRSSRSGARQSASSEDDNALFDCPVVSRKHAELSLDTLGTTTRVVITDTRSLHGTFVNGRRLAHWETTRLMHGDTVQFGSRVERAADSHEGFNIDVEITGSRPFESNTAGRFEVPYDDSEYISDEAEMSAPEEDDASVKITSSADTTPDKGADAAPTKSAPGSSIHDVIDLDPESYPRAPAARQPTEVVKDSLDSAYAPSMNEGDGLTGLLRPENGTFWEEPATGHAGNSFHNAEPYQSSSAQRQTSGSPAPSFNAGVNAIEPISDDDDDSSDDDSYAGNYPGETDAEKDTDGDSDSDDSSDSGASDHSAEGPEVMSSKPQTSPEQASQTSAAPFTDASASNNVPIPPKARYDPIRGFNYPALAPFQTAFGANQPTPTTHDRPYEMFRPTLSSAYGFADDGNSSRWDVGPGASSTYIPDLYPQGSHNFYNVMNEGALERAAAQQRALGMTTKQHNPVASDEAFGDWFFHDYLNAQREPRVRGEEPLATSASDPYRDFSDFRGGSKAPLKESVTESKMPAKLNAVQTGNNANNAESTAGADAPKPNKVSIMDLVQDAASQIERRITPPTAPKHSLPSIGTALSEQAAGSKRKAADISTDNDRDAQIQMLEKCGRERIRLARPEVNEQAPKPVSTRPFADTDASTKDDPWLDGWSDDNDERPLNPKFAKVLQQAEDASNASRERETWLWEDRVDDDGPSDPEFVDYLGDAGARVGMQEEANARKEKAQMEKEKSQQAEREMVQEFLHKDEEARREREETEAESPAAKKVKLSKRGGGVGVKGTIVRGVVKPAGWMTLGGLGTVAFLCSPLAEKLVGMI